MDDTKDRNAELKEWARKYAPKPPSNCPSCNGERELDGMGGAICCICGLTTTLEPKAAG